MATNASRKRASAADIAAAVALGTIDPSTTFATPDELAAAAESAQVAASITAAEPTRSADHHECGIPGCRHGAAVHGAPQPDRQVKLQCPGCGAVARMTGSALAKALGITCHRDGQTFAPAERRTYRRKTA